MARTRQALLQATALSIERDGVRRTTMVDVAMLSGVAKATLYNHFRTKDDLLAALVDTSVADLAARSREQPTLAGALAQVARELAGSAALRKVASDEPALLVALCAPGQARGWQGARDAVTSVLVGRGLAADAAQVEAVLRWFASQVFWPVTGEEAEHGADLLVRGLGSARVAGPAVDSTDLVAGPDQVARADTGASVTAGSGLGWPA